MQDIAAIVGRGGALGGDGVEEGYDGGTLFAGGSEEEDTGDAVGIEDGGADASCGVEGFEDVFVRIVSQMIRGELMGVTIYCPCDTVLYTNHVT